MFHMAYRLIFGVRVKAVIKVELVLLNILRQIDLLSVQPQNTA